MMNVRDLVTTLNEVNADGFGGAPVYCETETVSRVSVITTRTYGYPDDTIVNERVELQ